MAREIKLSELKAFVNEGKKKDWLANHYELPVAQVTKLLKDAGLKIRKFHRPKYTLVDDTEEQTTVENIEVQEAEVISVEDTIEENTQW